MTIIIEKKQGAEKPLNINFRTNPIIRKIHKRFILNVNRENTEKQRI